MSNLLIAQPERRPYLCIGNNNDETRTVMKREGRQTQSMTLRTDVHTARGGAKALATCPINPLSTPPLLTFVNTYIATPYVFVCLMRSEGRCTSFYLQNINIMKKNISFSADGLRPHACKRVRSNQPFSRRTQR